MARNQLSSLLLSLLFFCIISLADGRSLGTDDLAQEFRKRYIAKQTRSSIVKKSSFRFSNNETAPYAVQFLPLMSDDVGELYAGMMPVDKSNPDSAMFFIFQPTVSEPVDEITIWLQGGPGCSSLEVCAKIPVAIYGLFNLLLKGVFTRERMFNWAWGKYNADINPYAWSNLINMLWVEYPLGVGYSANYIPRATSEEEISQDFLLFFKNFQDTFGISKFKIYVTGESYAGYYVPYIADAMIKANDPEYYNVSGALIYAPTIGPSEYIHHSVPITPFIYERNQLLNLNDSFLMQLMDTHLACGFKDYISDWYKFPPTGNQPSGLNLSTAGNGDIDCDLWHLAYQEAYRPNNCFNVYSINLQCPLQFDPLGFPSDLIYLYPEFGEHAYFDRDDVKEAIHAPNISWSLCNGQAFNRTAAPDTSYGDTSADAIQGALPRVIDSTQRVLIVTGDFDMEIPELGVLLAIQNMTWGGKLGFQTEPNDSIDLNLPDLVYNEVYVESGFEGWDEPGQGIMGTQHFERGLMWAGTKLCGHMQPQFQPRSSYRHLQWLLGKTEIL